MGRTKIYLVAACLAFATARADTAPAAAPVPMVSIEGGRVLHNVSVLSVEGDSVVLRSDEGLVKLLRSQVPASLQLGPAPAATASGLMMPGFDPDKAGSAEANPAPVPNTAPAKPPARPSPTPVPRKRDPNPVYKGCTIVSFEAKAYQSVEGCAEVIIRNDSDQPVLLHPSDLCAILTNNRRKIGRNFIAIQYLPPAIRRREELGAHETLDDIVTFDNDPLDFSAVQWTH